MASTSYQTEAKDFAERLRQALQDAGVSVSATVLAHEFNIRYYGRSISTHAARNWLMGISLPKQDKLRVLAHWLKVSPEALLLGWQMARSDNTMGEISLSEGLNMADQHMLRSYVQLSAEHKRSVQTVVAAFAALDAQNAAKADRVAANEAAALAKAADKKEKSG
jgi:hypothetical protein